MVCLKSFSSGSVSSALIHKGKGFSSSGIGAHWSPLPWPGEQEQRSREVRYLLQGRWHRVPLSFSPVCFCLHVIPENLWGFLGEKAEQWHKMVSFRDSKNAVVREQRTSLPLFPQMGDPLLSPWRDGSVGDILGWEGSVLGSVLLREQTASCFWGSVALFAKQWEVVAEIQHWRGFSKYTWLVAEGERDSPRAISAS